MEYGGTLCNPGRDSHNRLTTHLPIKHGLNAGYVLRCLIYIPFCVHGTPQGPEKGKVNEKQEQEKRDGWKADEKRLSTFD